MRVSPHICGTRCFQDQRQLNRPFPCAWPERLQVTLACSELGVDPHHSPIYYLEALGPLAVHLRVPLAGDGAAGSPASLAAGSSCGSGPIG
eukprot:3809280-Pyramimonas_sp.AAC.1